VVEPGGGLPCHLRVALRARPARELASMLVPVAGGAVRREAEERAGPVALLAGDLCVLAHERVARLGVVERAASGLAPPDEAVLESLVLDMAGLAVPVVAACVQALAGRDPRLQRLVARQALRGGDPLVGVVAFEAAGASFERGVGSTQGAG
jgi:hypothetical protein